MSGEGRRVERADERIENMGDLTGVMKVNENGKIVIETDRPQTLWGFPIVVSDAIPKGTALMGRWPTMDEVREHGSFEKAIEAQKREWAMITGLDLNALTPN